MLTIKSPIELTCNEPMISSWETFYHRISGNYETLSSGIGSEDLLHVVTTPPEIYLAEASGTSILNQTTIQNRQMVKIDILNNLLNRISLEEEVDLTYQDRVYITNVLNRLGIKNVQEFMKQVRIMKKEASSTHQLISLYWENLEELRSMVEEYHQEENNERKLWLTRQENRQHSLYEEIMNRLQTGAIYRILNNFQKSIRNQGQYISSQELSLSEQKRISDQIFLNQMKSVVQGVSLPLVYEHNNFYEEMQLEEKQITQEDINSQITSAVLLNLADNLFLNRIEKKHQQHQLWLNLEDALYQSAENTLLRFREAVTSLRIREKKEENTSLLLSRIHENELQLTRQLVKAGQEKRVLEQQSTLINLLKEDTPFAEQQEVLEQDRVFREREIRTEREKEILQILTRQWLKEPEESPSFVPEPGRDVVKENTALTFAEYRQEEWTEENRYLNREQTREIQHRLSEKVLSGRENEAEPVSEGIEDQQQIVYPEDNVQLLEEQIYQINQQNIENWNRYRLLLEKAARERKSYSNPARRMKQESLRALENPQELLQEYRITHQEQEEERNQYLEEMIQLLPRETRMIYEKLEQFRKEPEGSAMEGITQNNIGLLLHDIEQTVQENRERTVLLHRQAETVREVSETILEKWTEGEAGEVPGPRGVEKVQKELSLVHKYLENQVDEELLQQLFEQNRLHQQKNRITEEIREENQTARTILQQNTNQMIIQEKEDMAELIQRGIQRQLGTLSDQIYSKLEKRLQNEKRRRGY